MAEAYDEVPRVAWLEDDASPWSMDTQCGQSNWADRADNTAERSHEELGSIGTFAFEAHETLEAHGAFEHGAFEAHIGTLRFLEKKIDWQIEHDVQGLDNQHEHNQQTENAHGLEGKGGTPMAGQVFVLPLNL